LVSLALAAAVVVVVFVAVAVSLLLLACLFSLQAQLLAVFSGVDPCSADLQVFLGQRPVKKKF
jgi:hypothetical protein